MLERVLQEIEGYANRDPDYGAGETDTQPESIAAAKRLAEFLDIQGALSDIVVCAEKDGGVDFASKDRSFGIGVELGVLCGYRKLPSGDYEWLDDTPFSEASEFKIPVQLRVWFGNAEKKV